MHRDFNVIYVIDSKKNEFSVAFFCLFIIIERSDNGYLLNKERGLTA